jgi:hypothetical protein
VFPGDEEALLVRTIQRIGGAVAALAVLSCVPGCGNMRNAAARQKTANDLRQIGLSYHNFHDMKMRGPSGPEDLASVPGLSAEEKALMARTGPGGDYVVYWSALLPLMAKKGPGASQVVLGYEKKVPTEGGMVLMGDASVQQMTAQDFAAAPKADQFTKE